MGPFNQTPTSTQTTSTHHQEQVLLSVSRPSKEIILPISYLLSSLLPALSATSTPFNQTHISIKKDYEINCNAAFQEWHMWSMYVPNLAQENKCELVYAPYDDLYPFALALNADIYGQGSMAAYIKICNQCNTDAIGWHGISLSFIRIGKLEATIASYEKSIGGLQSELALIRTGVEENKQAVSGLAGTVGSLSEAGVKSNQRMLDIETTVGQHKASVETQLSELQQSVLSKQSSVKEEIVQPSALGLAIAKHLEEQQTVGVAIAEHLNAALSPEVHALVEKMSLNAPMPQAQSAPTDIAITQESEQQPVSCIGESCQKSPQSLE